LAQVVSVQGRDYVECPGDCTARLRMCLLSNASKHAHSRPRLLSAPEDDLTRSVTFGVCVQNASVGADVRLVGSCDGLGCWCPSKGVPMSTSAKDGSVWEASVHLALETAGSIEYKFVLVVPGPGGEAVTVWEQGPNRHLSANPSGYVFAHFEETGCAVPGCLQAPARPVRVAGRTVVWEVLCDATSYGDTLLVVGADPALGAWDPDAGLQLSTDPSSFPWWRGGESLADCPQEVAWKLAVRRADGSVLWEPGANRETVLLDTSRGGGADLLQVTFGDQSEERHVTLSTKAVASPVEEDFEMDVDDAPSTEFDDAESAFTEWPWSMPTTPTLLPHMFTLGYTLHGGSSCIGKGDTCEDACFVGSSSAGVADGVSSIGNFASYGCSAADYAQELMALASADLPSGGDAPRAAPRLGPDERAVAAVAAAERGASTYGASTITVAHLDGSCLGVASLGDSGFMLLRRVDAGLVEGGATPGGFGIVTRSAEQQHGWNFPFQLLRVPAALQRLSRKQKLDTADDCQRYRIPVRPGDLLLLYSDGFSDNLYEHEILEAVQRLTSCTDGRLADPRGLATELALLARAHSLDPAAHVPFEDSALEQAGLVFEGGKVDDITVVAAWVVQERGLKGSA